MAEDIQIARMTKEDTRIEAQKTRTRGGTGLFLISQMVFERLNQIYIKNIHLIIFGICLFLVNPIWSQNNFRQGLEASNPIDINADLSLEKKLEIHQDYLSGALEKGDDLQQIYAQLHIFMDYIQADKFAEASLHLLESEKIAEDSGNKGWQGWVIYRSGILYIRMDQHKIAIENYEKAVILCGEAKDSLCLGESLEQLGTLNGLFGHYEKAEGYFSQALPILGKYGEEKHVAGALNNFAGLLSQQGNTDKAIPLFKESIALNQKMKRYRYEGKAMNNLADAYRRSKQYDKAIEMYTKSIEFNLKHDFDENRIRNYMGLSLVYEAKNDFKTANDFLSQRFLLRDSLTGLKTQEKMISLEAKYENKKKEAALEKSRAELISARRSTERIIFFFSFILLVAALYLWYLYQQKQQIKQKLLQNKENLTKITQSLIQKNTQLKTMEEEILALNSTKDNTKDSTNTNTTYSAMVNAKTKYVTSNFKNFEDNLYNQNILTEDDWTSFKLFFEQTHSGYIKRLRSKNLSMSEAEERLFLLLKLKLTRKEIAAILGINPDSVKKTRSRLRKRLSFNREDSLENYIQQF